MTPVKAPAQGTPVLLMKFTVQSQGYELILTDGIGFGLSPREAGRIKSLTSTNVSGIDIIKEAGNADVEVLAALSIVAMERAKQTPDIDAIMDGKVGLEVEVENVMDPTHPDGDPGKEILLTTSTTLDGGGDQ